jgi:hypothetical protein
MSYALHIVWINVRENRMGNPETLAALGTQDKDKQKQNTTQKT